MKIYEMHLNEVQKEVVREAVSLWKDVTRGNIEAAFEKLPLAPDYDMSLYSDLLERVKSVYGGHFSVVYQRVNLPSFAPSSRNVFRLTEDQMSEIQHSLDMFTRLQMGQIRSAFDRMPLYTHLNWDLANSLHDKVHSVLPKILIQGIDGWGSSLGIGHRDLPPSNSIAWDICCTIRHCLSWHYAIESGWVESMDSPRDWGKMLGVNYDKPFGWGREPLPKIALVYNGCPQGKTKVLQ